VSRTTSESSQTPSLPRHPPNGQVHAALIEAYPTEEDARRALVTMSASATYLGVWRAPTPELPEVHVFAEGYNHADMLAAGWTRV